MSASGRWDSDRTWRQRSDTQSNRSSEEGGGRGGLAGRTQRIKCSQETPADHLVLLLLEGSASRPGVGFQQEEEKPKYGEKKTTSGMIGCTSAASLSVSQSVRCP